MFWWETYFTDGWQAMLPHLRGKQATKNEIACLDYLLQQNSGQTVLDVPCSTGRIALDLAKLGYNVTALDYNPKLLEKGKATALKKNLPPINWLQADMRQMPLPNQCFDMVACIFGSFGYFDDAGNHAFLTEAARVLKPNGQLVLETHTLETLLPIFTEHGVWRFNNCLVIEECQFDPFTGRLNGEWTVLKGKKQYQMQSSLRMYSLPQLHNLLRQAGFNDIQYYSDYTLTPYQYGDDLLVCVCTKGEVV